MKKFLLLTLTISLTSLAFGQEIPQLKLTPKGVEPIVVEVDSLSASDIYKKALNWVQETYKNPDEVLKTNIANKKIRVIGFAKDGWWYKNFLGKQFYNMKYTVEISFKDGRYRFEYIIGQFYIDGGKKFLADYKSFFKRNGDTRKVYSDAVPSLEQTMNNLSLSFYNYATGKTSAKDNDW